MSDTAEIVVLLNAHRDALCGIAADIIESQAAELAALRAELAAQRETLGLTTITLESRERNIEDMAAEHARISGELAAVKRDAANVRSALVELVALHDLYLNTGTSDYDLHFDRRLEAWDAAREALKEPKHV
jgi:chromosome segregation ATPase